MSFVYKMNVRHLSVLCLLALVACDRASTANVENFTAAMNQYLDARGDLCLAKTEWPIDVSPGDVERGARNAVQLPVLERLGLVSSSSATVEVSSEDKPVRTTVTRYALTDAGKKYYLTRKSKRDETQTSSAAVAVADFCPVKLGLDKVVSWKAASNAKGEQHALVSYTYTVNAAPWTNDAEVMKVFPVVASVTAGARHSQLQESFKLTDAGWVAEDL